MKRDLKNGKNCKNCLRVFEDLELLQKFEYTRYETLEEEPLETRDDHYVQMVRQMNKSVIISIYAGFKYVRADYFSPERGL